jgi:Cdc6-like AAA superfamily ATPase
MTPDQHEQIGIRAGYRLSEKLYHKAVMVLDLVDFMFEHSSKKRTYSEGDLAWTLTN